MSKKRFWEEEEVEKYEYEQSDESSKEILDEPLFEEEEVKLAKHEEQAPEPEPEKVEEVAAPEPVAAPTSKQPVMLQTAAKAFVSNKHRATKARKYLPTRTRFS